VSVKAPELLLPQWFVMDDGSPEQLRGARKRGLCIRTERPYAIALGMNLVDAIEARAQLDACIQQLTAALDVKAPPDRTGSGD